MGGSMGTSPTNHRWESAPSVNFWATSLFFGQTAFIRQSPLEGRGLQGGQETQQPILGRRQGTGLSGGRPARRARRPIAAPLGPRGLKGGRKRRDEPPTRLQRQTGHIQPLERAALEIGEASMPHGCGLLSVEA